MSSISRISGIHAGAVVDPEPDGAEDVEARAGRAQRLVEVLALEPEVGRALVRDLARDAEGKLDRIEGALERDQVADLPVVLPQGGAPDDGAIAVAPEVLELLRIEVPIGPDHPDRVGLDREVRKGDTLVFVEDAAEPGPARGAHHPRQRAHLLEIGVGERIDQTGLVVHHDARVRRHLLDDAPQSLGHGLEQADQRDRQRDGAAGQQAAQLVAGEIAPDEGEELHPPARAAPPATESTSTPLSR
jgi:hypothetical protein